MQNTLLIHKSIFVEVIFTNTPANGQQIAFQDVPQLRNSLVMGIEAFNRAGVAISVTGASVVLTTAGLAVTFAVNSDERLFQWPVYSLQSSANGGLIREINNLNINLPKSYITILDATQVNQNEAAVFNFYYRDKI